MNRIATTGLIAVAQALLIAVAIAPQASARLTGETYTLRVGPVDPIDPYRGAYVALDYPDLEMPGDSTTGAEIMSATDGQMLGQAGGVYITLREEGGVWVGDEFLLDRPDGVPYLSCHNQGWDIVCGIESYFLPQDSARAAEVSLSDGAYADVKVDSRGNAALVDVSATID